MLKTFIMILIVLLIPGCSSALISNTQGGPEGITSARIETMAPKSTKTITITEQEFQKVTQEAEYEGKNEIKSLERNAESTGISALEAAAMDQGITGSSIGQSKGYGILEKIWTYIRSSLWIIVAYFVIYGGFSIAGLKIPILGTISKVMLSIATCGISIISWVVDAIKAKTSAAETEKVSLALHQTVLGIDEAKKIEPKFKITLNSELEKTQDTTSKDIIRKIRNYNFSAKK